MGETPGLQRSKSGKRADALHKTRLFLQIGGLALRRMVEGAEGTEPEASLGDAPMSVLELRFELSVFFSYT